jgi:hypothetical protein
MKTLGPMSKLNPSETVELVEHWGLFRDIKPNAITDEELDRVLLPVLKSVGGAE